MPTAIPFVLAITYLLSLVRLIKINIIQNDVKKFYYKKWLIAI